MVTTLLNRAMAAGAPQPRRAMVVAERNLIAIRAGGVYWWVVVAGLAEPLLYLLAVGWGVGALTGDITLPDGRAVPYLTFLAPAMLAAAAMNGATAESMNFFTRLRLVKQYEPALNTPVTPVELAFGELAWGMLRGAAYIVAFLAVMAAMGLTTPLLALAALPAALLVGVAFSGLGMALVTMMRGWQDLDHVFVTQFALFLFSGTFVPAESYPAAVQVLVRLTPLYHGVELIRSITTGALGWSHAYHAGYLLAAAALGLAVAARRTTRILRT